MKEAKKKIFEKIEELEKLINSNQTIDKSKQSIDTSVYNQQKKPDISQSRSTSKL